MNKFAHIASLFVLLILLLPLNAGAIVEPDTKMEYDDTVVVDSEVGGHNLVVTGVGLREKTFMKVNVYVIVSYMLEGTELEGDQGVALLNLDAPKMIQMDLVRGFSREKLVNAFKEVIEKNYDDMSAFQAEMDEFFAYFKKDAEEGDKLIFTYLPSVGLNTVLNGEDQGLITNFEFVKALWTVWFGEKPASDGLKKDLLAKVAP